MMVDLNDLRSLWTLASFLTFVGIVLWAWSRRSQPGFQQAAMLPLDDEHLAHPRQPIAAATRREK